MLRVHSTSTYVLILSFQVYICGISRNNADDYWLPDMGCSKLRFVTIFLLGVTVCGAVNDVHIYVSQHGSDQNDG